MNRRYKVKHYRSRIYNPIRGKIIKILLAVLAAAVLFTVGWFAYEPIMQAVNEKNKEIIEDEPIPPKPQEPAYEPPVEEFLEKQTLAVTVPEEALYSALDYYDFLKSLDKETTAIVIDMKTQKGTVTYVSDHISVANAGAVHENAVDLEGRIKTARKLGFDVIARIYAFEDSTTPYNASDMAIRYESEEGVLWLDDSVDNGGKPWLNPYSDTAQKYILDIVYDAIDMEVDAILLEGLRFPENEGMDYAYFGVGAEEKTHGEVISQFTQRVYSTAVLTETDVIIGYDSFAAITGSDIYGGDPLSFSGDGFAPYININDYIGEKINDDFNFKKLPEDITEVFDKIYDSLGDVSSLNMLPVISCEGFSKADMAGIWNRIEERGTVGYIIIYDEPYFTGIPEEPEENPEETPGTTTPAVPNVPAAPQQPQPQPQPQPQQPEVQPEEQPPETTLEGDNTENDENETPGVIVKDYEGQEE